MAHESGESSAGTSASPLVAAAQEFYGTLLTDFEAALRNHVAESFVLENLLPDEIPFGGRYEGHAGLARYLGELGAAIEMGPLELHEWVDSGRSVVVRGSESSVVRATGKRYSMNFVHWLDFDEQGRVLSMREYNDTAAMLTAFLADPSSPRT